MEFLQYLRGPRTDPSNPAAVFVVVALTQGGLLRPDPGITSGGGVMRVHPIP